MHELSLCRSIHGIVDRARGERRVRTVHLRVGRLRQVVPDTLVHCWGLLTEEGPLAGSRLEIDQVPVLLRCRDCGAGTGVVHELVLTCGECGSAAVVPETGEEFLVTSLDLERES